MKYILILALTILSLHAQLDKKEMYAKVKSQSADLYARPYQCSKKKVAYFSKGDMIEISYCDKYRWCKTTNGFVKKNLLRLPEPLRRQDTPMPSTVMKPSEVNKTQKVELIAKPVIINESNSVAQVVEIVSEKKLDAYDEYFSNESVKVIFKEK